MSALRDDSKLLRDEIVRKYREISERLSVNAAQIKKLQDQQVNLNSQANDCRAAARLFGFELAARAERGVTMFDQMSVDASRTAQASAGDSNPTIREFLLDALREVAPAGMKARELRAQIEAKGQTIHEKTVGMTLYRLSKSEGSVKRSGFTWSFVPEAERPAREGPNT